MVAAAGLMEIVTGTTVRLAALVAVPPGVVTEIFPVVAPGGTVSVMEVGLWTERVATLVELTLAAVAPDRFVPVTVMTVPIPELVGVRLLMVGVGIAVKVVDEVAVPPGVVTLRVPVVTPVGAVAEIVVGLLTVNLEAAVPLNLTDVAPVKSDPVRVTMVAAPPLVGVMPEMVGGTTTVKVPELLTVPPAVVTLSLPLEAPAGTTAVIEVELTTV